MAYVHIWHAHGLPCTNGIEGGIANLPELQKLTIIYRAYT